MGDESRNIRGRSAEMMPGVKEKYECIRDDECASAQKCHNNKCTPVCTAAPCPPDQYCIAQSGHARICVTCLTDSHCRAGKSCSADGACLSCSAGATGCNCPGSAPYANGSGGCVACVNALQCGSGRTCNAGACVSCSAGATGCNCPGSAPYANGSGGCVACVNALQCGSGRTCNAGACVSCSAGTTGCNCPGSTPYANGSGGCVACTQTSHCPYRNECRNNTCVERVTCPDNCLQCTDSETCTRCVSGFRLIFGECRGYGCTTGQWIDGEWVEGKCL